MVEVCFDRNHRLVPRQRSFAGTGCGSSRPMIASDPRVGVSHPPAASTWRTEVRRTVPLRTLRASTSKEHRLRDHGPRPVPGHSIREVFDVTRATADTIVASGQILGSLGLCATRTSPSSDLQCPGPVSYAQSPPLPALLARRGRASVPHPHRPTRTRTVRPHPQHTMVPRGGGRPVGPRRPHRVITLTHQTEAPRAWPCPTSDQDRTMVPPGYPSARCPCAPETAGRVFCKVVGWYCSPPSK